MCCRIVINNNPGVLGIFIVVVVPKTTACVWCLLSIFGMSDMKGMCESGQPNKTRTWCARYALFIAYTTPRPARMSFVDHAAIPLASCHNLTSSHLCETLHKKSYVDSSVVTPQWWLSWRTKRIPRRHIIALASSTHLPPALRIIVLVCCAVQIAHASREHLCQWGVFPPT